MTRRGDEDLRIGVLGPLAGTRGGVTVKLPRGRVGVLLAVLAMSAGHPVSADRLTGLIWPEDQPERVRPSLHSLVARLRAVVPGVIVTIGDGYLLDIDTDQVDLLQFRRLVRAAHKADDVNTAADLLDQALRLWRSEPLADLRSSALDREVVPGLTDEHLSAVQRRAELDLAAGHHDRVIAELRGLTSRYPLREPLWGQLLRALVASRRPAEAIREYHRAREILATELGIDPSPDLQEAYRQLLQADQHAAPAGQSPAGPGKLSPGAVRPFPDTPPVALPGNYLTEWAPSAPRQLPAGATGFAGRAAPLSLLSGLADQEMTEPGAVLISAISGMPGVGKTALALHWAHREAARFPDGQLYADLRGFGPSGAPASPADVVREFLDALGVPLALIPVSFEAQAGLYRTVLAGRRIMIVLDNARDADQVRPLLPGSPECMTVITSRNPLTSLAAGHGARLIRLELPSAYEAAELLAARLGPNRVAADPATAAELVALCGRLPLALSITAARAAARPHLPLAVFTAELCDARQQLDALDGGDPASNLRAVFSWSCQQLSDAAAALFRLLGVHPGPDISLSAAAIMAGAGLAHTRAALRELADLNLAAERRPGRYVLHDLIRVYAAEQATTVLTAGNRSAAIQRILDHYMHTARHAAIFNTEHYSVPLPQPQGDAVIERFDSSKQATKWFDAEYRVLLAATGLAASNGFDSHAWQIAAALARYLDSHGHWGDWADMQRTALAAARRLGDENAQACVVRASGGLYLRRASYDQARKHFLQALQLYRDIDDPVGQALTYGSLSMTFALEDRYRQALAHSEHALELARSAGYPHLRATMLNKVGWHAAHLGDYQRALACCLEALDLLQDLGNRYAEGCVWDSLGYIHRHLGHPAESTDCYQLAISSFREIGNRTELADTLISLGHACDAAGRPTAARDAWQEALTILGGLHHPAAERIHAKLRHCERDPVPNRLLN